MRGGVWFGVLPTLETPMDRPAGTALLDRFAALKDPRQVAKVLHPLPEILPLLLAATLAGADDFVEIGLWGEENLAFLRRQLAYRHGGCRAIDGQEAIDPIP